MTPDGDYLMSFRGLSAIFKIARTAHDGFEKGEVIWRLGGRRSDFDFVGDEHGGPCAQHTASMLPNGNVLIFDNGSRAGAAHPGFCVDQGDRDGDTQERTISRYVEWSLVEPASGRRGTATLVQEYAPGHFAPFTGSAFRLPNGNTLIGWGAAPTAVATELDPSGQRIWELTTPTEQGSYRVYRETVPDAFEPQADLSVPADGATYLQGAREQADYGCTDRGGSDLVTCAGPAASGGLLDTSVPGEHGFPVTAVDGEGNRTTRRHSYTVTPAEVTPAPPVAAKPAGKPDLMIRKRQRPWVGSGRASPARQRIRLLVRPGEVVRAQVRLVNAGPEDRFVLRGARRTRACT